MNRGNEENEPLERCGKPFSENKKNERTFFITAN